MTNQYFENNQNLANNPKKIDYYYKGQLLHFITDNGVFSKDSVDFGSSLLLKSLELNDAKSLLDVGCGYGPMGITIAKMNPNIKVKMVDVNLRALELTRKNAEINAVNNVEISESFAYQNVSEKYDIIITNPPIRAGKKVVYEILGESINYLNSGGCLWCVIRKEQGALSAIKKLKTIFDEVETVAIDKGYYIISSKRVIKQ